MKIFTKYDFHFEKTTINISWMPFEFKCSNVRLCFPETMFVLNQLLERVRVRSHDRRNEMRFQTGVKLMTFHFG